MRSIRDDPVVAEVRFVPFDEILGLRMFPAIQAPLTAYLRGGSGQAPYHGRLWVEK